MRIITMKRRMWIALLGMLLAPAIARAQSDEVVYYHTDAIGSVRMVTNASGVAIARYDFLTFGEAWVPPTSPDVREFAGKERDAETDLDYFGARYYRAQSGRFTTVDPLLNIEAALTDPQRWNRYAYAANNPLKFVDPDGREIWLSAAHQRALSAAGVRAAPAVAMGLEAAAVAGALYAAPTALRAAVGCFLSPSCQSGVIAAVEDLAGGAPRPSAVRTSAASRVGLAGAAEGSAVMAEAVAPRVTFGHGARHLSGTGLAATDVESLITKQINEIAGRSQISGSFYGRVEIGKITITYRAALLKDGSINVGTYYPPLF